MLLAYSPIVRAKPLEVKQSMKGLGMGDEGGEASRYVTLVREEVNYGVVRAILSIGDHESIATIGWWKWPHYV
jgi:hypothetical protein